MNTKRFTELTQALASNSNATEVYTIFASLLSAKELQDMENRLEIIHQLHQGKTQREIAENLKVGIATVTRGSKAYKSGIFTPLLNCLDKHNET